MAKVMSFVRSAILTMTICIPAWGQNLFTSTNPTGGITVTGYVEEDFGPTESGVNIAFTFTGPGQILEIVPANVSGRTGERVLRYLRLTATAASGGVAPVVAIKMPNYPSLYIRRVGEITQLSGSAPVVVECIGVGQIGTSDTQPAFLTAAQFGNITATTNVNLAGHTGDIFVDVLAHGGGVLSGSVTERIVPGTSGRFNGTVLAGFEFYGVDSPGGDIGTAATPASLTAKVIGSIRGRRIYADILTQPQDGNDYIGQVEATAGPIVGSINTGGIVPPNIGGFTTCFIKASGDLDVDITTVRDAAPFNGINPIISAGGEFPAHRTMRIGRHVLSNTSGGGGISLGSNGLKGQIIINQRNGFGGIGIGRWEAPIKVGTTSIAMSPFSRPASSSFGGGSVTLAPQCLYNNDCVPIAPAIASPIVLPASATSLVPSDLDPSGPGAVIRFDGPVQLGSGAVFAVDCAPLSFANDLCDVPTWQTVTSGFQLQGPTSSTGIGSRQVTLRAATGSTIGPGVFRVRFLNLRSMSVSGTPLVVLPVYCSNIDDPDSSRAYYFRVGPDCNTDGIDDIFLPPPQGSPACQTGCGDFNGVDGVSVADIFDYLNAWFAGSAGC